MLENPSNFPYINNIIFFFIEDGLKPPNISK